MIYVMKQRFLTDDIFHILKFIRMLVQFKKKFLDSVYVEDECAIAFKKKYFDSMWFFILPTNFNSFLSADELERKENRWQEVNETFHGRFGYEGSISYLFQRDKKSCDLWEISGNPKRLRMDTRVNLLLITFSLLCLYNLFSVDSRDREISFYR